MNSELHVKLLRNIGKSKLYTGNSVAVFTTGKKMTSSLRDSIEKAEKFIHLQFYIFQNDEIGIELRDLLIKKARQGVEVRLRYDDVGSLKVKNHFFNDMKEHGIEINAFYEVKIPVFARKINYRNHRKIAIIAGKYGFIGGMNIADRYI